jgi:hypothetical protein
MGVRARINLRTNANLYSRQFSLSCLVSMLDEEFDVLVRKISHC